MGKESLKTCLWLQKPVGVVGAGETDSLTGESVGGAHGVLQSTHPSTLELAPGQHLEERNLFLESGESE